MITNLAQGHQVFTSNAFLVTPDDAGPDGRTVVVDPGNEFDAVAEIREHVTDVDAVVLTHTHSDHVGNVEAVREAFDVPVYGYDADHDAVDPTDAGPSDAVVSAWRETSDAFLDAMDG